MNNPIPFINKLHLLYKYRGLFKVLYRYYLTPRSSLNPFYILARELFHSSKEYYLCFENIPLALPLEERLSYDWFTEYGYAYDFNGGYEGAKDPTIRNKQKRFFEIFTSNVSIKRAKLTEQDDCQNFEKVKSLHSYEVRSPIG